jgi:hypothetical protein
MRRLSERQARNCEEARLPRCRCRCGGALHGAKRGGDNPPREWYESLPPDDPHKIGPVRYVQLELFPELEQQA